MIAGVTGRVRKYAVVEVTMVDLAGANPLGQDAGDLDGTPHRAP